MNPTPRLTLALCAMLNNASTSRFNFRSTFAALRPILDEAVIGVSTQSIDDTRALAEGIQDEFRDIPIQVFDYDWRDDFGHMLNTLLDRTDADWRLRLHQDRYVDPLQLRNLRAFIDDDPALDIILFGQLDQDGRRFRGYTETLFRSGLRFDGNIWEHLVRDVELPEGTIKDRFVTADQMHNSVFRYCHDDGHGGPREQRNRYHEELAKLDIQRIGRLERTARTAADYFLIGSRAMVLSALGADIEMARAIHALETSAELEPEEPGPLVYMGDCHRIAGDHSSAQQCYAQAIERGSEVASARVDWVTRF